MKKMKNGYYSSPGDDQELFMNHDYDQIKTEGWIKPLKVDDIKNERHKSRLKTLKN